MGAITVEWDALDRDITCSDWNRHLKRYRFSTVFQNWSYGAASAEHDGFKLLRGYVCKNGRVMGLVQAFIRRSFLIGRTVRIVRGISKRASAAEQERNRRSTSALLRVVEKTEPTPKGDR